MKNEKLGEMVFWGLMIVAGVVGLVVAVVGEYQLIRDLPPGQYPMLIFAIPLLVGAAAAAAVFSLIFIPTIASNVASMFEPLITGWAPLGKLLSGKQLHWLEREKLHGFGGTVVGALTVIGGEFYVLTAYNDPGLLLLLLPLAAGFIMMLVSYGIFQKLI